MRGLHDHLPVLTIQHQTAGESRPGVLTKTTFCQETRMHINIYNRDEWWSTGKKTWTELGEKRNAIIKFPTSYPDTLITLLAVCKRNPQVNSISLTEGQQCRKHFHVMTSPCTLTNSTIIDKILAIPWSVSVVSVDRGLSANPCLLQHYCTQAGIS